MSDRDTSRDYRIVNEWRNGRNERNATAIGAEHLNHKGILYVPFEQLDAAEAAAEMLETATKTNLQAYGECKARLDAAERELVVAQSEVKRVRGLINRDRTGLAAALDAVRELLNGFSWLANEFEWGSYQYGDHRIGTLRAEIGSCFDQIGSVIDKALKASGDRATLAFHPENDQLQNLETERDEAIALMSGISSYLGCGLGDESTTMAQYLERIRDGIGMQERVMASRLAGKDVVIDELRAQLAPKCETCSWWRGVSLEQAQDAECFNRDGLVSPPRDGKGSCCFHSRLVPVS